MATHIHDLGRLDVGGATPTSRRVASALTTTGRIFFAVPFGVFGVSHFVNANEMAAHVPLPGGLFWIYFTGLALVAGALGILTGILGRWAALGLAALMLVFVFAVHLPGIRDPARAPLAVMSLLKDLALAGGALTWAGIFARTPRTR
jgi:uncharacterized membrane protein YphA (DoxX/SURF4 family)